MAHPRIVIAPNDDPRWALARDGDREARNSLVNEHIRLLDQVTAVVCARLPSYADREDIWSFGSFGLIRAVETYDPEIASFRTHAVFLIKARIYDELRSMDWLPKSARKRVREVEAAREVLERDGDEVSDEAVAQALQMDTADVYLAALDRRASYVQSLHDHDHHRGVHEDPQDSLSVAEYLHTFGQWLEELPEDEQAVWALRFFERQTSSEVAETLGVSLPYVSKVSRKIFQSFNGYVESMLRVG